MEIEIPAAIRAKLIREGGATYPAECCGLLIGRRSGDRVMVHEAVESANLETARPDRYVVDPRVIMAVDKRALAAGMEIVGVYHSHPDHEAMPSITDRELAWEGLIYVIVPVWSGVAREMRAWRFAAHDSPVEVAVR